MAVLVFVPGAQAARIGSPWTWTDRAPELRDVSCSTAAQCVSVGDLGVALRSTPGLDQPLAWSGVGLKYPEDLVGVTCHAQTCLAVSDVRTELSTYKSKVFRSTDGGATWPSVVTLDAWDKPNPTHVGSAIACDPDAANCYVAGRGGGIWRSTDDGRTWDDLPPTKRHYAWLKLACPATATCVVVGGDDDFQSAVVKGDKTTALDPPTGATGGANAVACDQPTRCVAATTNNSFITMDVPAEKWAPARPVIPGKKALSIASLSCPQPDTCVGIAAGGPGAPLYGVKTVNLSSASGGWERRPLGTNVESISCVATSCSAAGRYAAWYDSFNVGTDWGRVNEVPAFNAGQCLPIMNGNCVAGGDKDIGISRSGGELWAPLPLAATPKLDIKVVNCSGPTTCLFLGKESTLFSSDLQGFGTRFATTADPAGTDALACSSYLVCEGGGEGVTYTTFNAALTSWEQSGFPTRPSAMACIPGRTDPVVCVATTRDFIYRGTMTRENGLVKWNWIATVDPAEILNAIACSPGGQCTAVGVNGDVLTSQDPALLDWKEYTIPEGQIPEQNGVFSAVACPADGVCLAGGNHGNKAIIASTTDNWVDYSYEEIGPLSSPTPTVLGFACRDVNMCLAMGQTMMLSGARTS